MDIRGRRTFLRPLLAEMAARCGEAAGFGRIRGGFAVLEECVGPAGSHHRPWVGAKLPVYASALGTVLLAHQRCVPRRVGVGASRLTRRARKAPANREELLQHLASVRRRGFAIEEEAIREGVCAVAVPVWGTRGEPVGGLVIEGPRSRFDPARLAGELVPLAQDIATRLTARLAVEDEWRNGNSAAESTQKQNGEYVLPGATA